MNASAAPPVTGESPAIGFVILVAAAAALGGFLFVFDTAVINGAVIALKREFGGETVPGWLYSARRPTHGRGMRLLLPGPVFLDPYRQH